jgi:hypothetical protein
MNLSLDIFPLNLFTVRLGVCVFRLYKNKIHNVTGIGISVVVNEMANTGT